jgi:hypothetical protein
MTVVLPIANLLFAAGSWNEPNTDPFFKELPVSPRM